MPSRKLSKKDMRAFKAYEKEMREVAIPQIVKDVRKRQQLAQKSKHWIIG